MSGKIKNNKFYFGEVEEEAVLLFNSAETFEERNAIYNKHLRAPLNKMVESIINRYKLHRKGVPFKENHNDALADIVFKANKFKEEKNTKAYSYYSAVCTNYLKATIKKDRVDFLRHNQFETVTSKIEEDDKYQYCIDDDFVNPSDLIVNLIEEIKDVLQDNEDGLLKKRLNDNEIRLGFALIDILSNPTLYFSDGFETPKYNKNAVLFVIREYTGLTTKDIRLALQRYKSIYKMIQNEMITNGSIE